MNADGSDQIRLTNDPTPDYAPSWSPDGNQIVFSSNRDGNAGDIYVMNADGSGEIRLTNDAAVDANPDWGS